MSVPQQLPLRVLVKGASLDHDVSEFPQLREQFVFPRVIEETLLSRGLPVHVWNPAVASEMASMSMKNWEPHVKAWGPDVIIVTWGYYECVHLFLPRWLERHANSLKAKQGRFRTFYRNRILRPVWKVLAGVQREVDRKVQARFFKPRARRYTRHMRYFIDQSRKVGRPLVVIPEFLEPSARGLYWFPGMGARAEIINEEVRALVESYDDHVVRLPVPQIAARRSDLDVEPTADGFHYNAEVHQLVGEAYADLIESWVKQYPRLTGERTGLPGHDDAATGS